MNIDKDLVITLNIISLSLAWKYCKNSNYKILDNSFNMGSAAWKIFSHFRSGRLNNKESTEKRPIRLTLTHASCMAEKTGIPKEVFLGSEVLFPENKINLLIEYVKVSEQIRQEKKVRASKEYQPLNQRKRILENAIVTQLKADYKQLTPFAMLSDNNYMKMLSFVRYDQKCPDATALYQMIGTLPPLSNKEFWEMLDDSTTEQLEKAYEKLSRQAALVKSKLILRIDQ